MNQKPFLGKQINKSHPLARGLVGSWILNEGSGSIVQDGSGNGNKGTLTNMDPETDWIAGPDGPALDFDGTGHIVVPSRPHDNLQNFTVGVWVKLTSETARNDIVAAWADTGERQFVILSGVTTGEYSLFIGQTNASLFNATGGTVVANTWTYIVGTYNIAGDLRLYQDGVLVGSGSADGSLDSTSANFKIGSNSDTPIFYTTGNINDVTLYNRALSSSEVQYLYQDPYQMYRRQNIELWSAATQVAGGTNYTESLSDTLTLADTLISQATYLRLLSDAQTLVDTLAKSEEKSLTDSLTTSDLLNKISEFNRELSDTLTHADSLDKIIEFNKSLSDSMDMSDTIERQVEFTKLLSDVQTLSDDLQRTVEFNRDLTDTVDISDSINTITEIIRIVLEVIRIGQNKFDNKLISNDAVIKLKKGGTIKI